MDYEKIEAALQAAKTDEQLASAIVNAPFAQQMESAMLFLGIMVLLVVNKSTGMIDRVALSNTELANNTTTVTAVPFQAIKIPVNNQQNTVAKAIQSGIPQETIDWDTLFTPALSADEARLNQASGGIAYSAVYPIKKWKGGAAIIFSYYQYADQIGDAQHEFMQRYAAIVSDNLLY